MVSTVVRSKAGRPKQDPVIAEREALHRIARLASEVMIALRQPGRGKFSSERSLSRWLTSDGVQYTTGDLADSLPVTGDDPAPYTASCGFSEHLSTSWMACP